MGFREILPAFSADTFDQAPRPLLLRRGSDRKSLEQLLLVQRIDIAEEFVVDFFGKTS